MTLTPKREKFAQCVADGMSQAEAYRTAYPRSLAWNQATVHQAASRLMANGKVSARVAELRAEVAKKHLWTREMSVKALVGAYKEGNPAVKVAAVKELNAMHGFNAPQKVDVLNSDGSMAPTLIKIVAAKK